MLPQVRLNKGRATVVIGAILIIVPTAPPPSTIFSSAQINTGGIRIR